MAASSIGAQMGIIASPVSVAVVSLVAMLSSYTFNGRHLEFLDLLSITIPSTLCGIPGDRHLQLVPRQRDKDRSSRNSSQCRKTIAMSMAMPPPLDRVLPRSNWIAMWIFLATIALVAVLAFSDLRPSFGGKPLSMVTVIQMCMLMAGALIVIITRTNPASISKTKCSAPA